MHCLHGRPVLRLQVLSGASLLWPHIAQPCFDIAVARLEQPFQINDSVACQNPDEPRHPRHLQARECLNGHAERLVRTEGWGALLLFFFGFLCYRVRSACRLLEHWCAYTELTPHPQGFFYSCHRLKLSLKASCAVHPMLTAAVAAEVEEGVYGAPAGLKGRPRGRAARASALEVMTVQATDAPLGGL